MVQQSKEDFDSMMAERLRTEECFRCGKMITHYPVKYSFVYCLHSHIDCPPKKKKKIKKDT